MRCDCWHIDHGRDEKNRILRCTTEGQPSSTQPPLAQYAAEGWFIAQTSGDRCPSCRAQGHGSNVTPWDGAE
jgi:hypothetical protein